jgi:ADP-ribose pyrophosphatase
MGITPWELLGSKDAFKNRWWHIVQETVRLPDGSVTGEYYVNHSAGGVSVFAVTESGNVLVNRQYKHGAREIVLEMTVGRLDGDEGGPMAEAKRELMEETGYGEGEWEQLLTTVTNPTSSTSRIHVFLARGVRKLAEPQSDPRETVEVREVPPKEFMRMLMDGELTSQTAMTTSYLAAKRLGWISANV